MLRPTSDPLAEAASEVGVPPLLRMAADEVLLEVANVRVLVLAQVAAHRLLEAVRDEVVLQVAYFLEFFIALVHETCELERELLQVAVVFPADGVPLFRVLLQR